MAEDLIDSYIDRQALAGDTKYFLEQLNEVDRQLKTLDGYKVKLSFDKSGRDILSTLKNISQTQSELVQSTNKFTAAKAKEADTDIKAAKAAQLSADAKLKEAKAANEAAKAKLNESKATEQTSRSRAAEKKLLDQAVNDYFQLSRAYDEAALKAKNLAILMQDDSHPAVVQATKDANDLGNYLKKLDASVGQNQRNVGNYKSAFDGLGFSFTQVARELPSLTINLQQFALAISNNLPMVADELKRAKDEIAAMKAEGKEVPSLFSRITKSLFGWQVLLSVAISGLTYLAGAFKSTGSETKKAQKAQEDFTNAVKEANDAIQKQIDLLEPTYSNSLNGLKEQLNYAEKIGASQVSILALRQKIATEEKKIIDEQVKAQENLLIGNTNIQLNGKKGIEALVEGQKYYLDNVKTFNSRIISLENERALAIKEGNTDLQERIEKDIEVQKSWLNSTESTYGAISNTINKFNSNRISFTDISADANNLALANAKANAEARLLLEKELADQQRKIAETEVIYSYEKRKGAYEKEAEIRKKIIEGQFQIDVKYGKLSAGEIEKARTQMAINIREIEGALATDLINLWASVKEAEINNRQEILAMAEKQAEELEKIDEQVLQGKLAGLQKNLQSELDAITISSNERIIKENERYNKELAAAGTNQDKREKAEKKHQKNLTIIQNDAAESALRVQIGIYETMASILDLPADQIDKLKSKLSELRVELSKLKDPVEESKASFTDYFQKGAELFGSIISFATVGGEKEIETINQQIDLLNEKKAKEIEGIRQTALSEEEKANKIKILEASTQAQREALEARQRKIKRENAKYEKAALVAKSIADGISAVNEALPNIPLSILVGLIAAGNVAKIIATPLPQYKHGKNVNSLDSYEGPAIVGDGGKQELIVRENGGVELTDSKPQLTYLKSNDIVLPDAKKALSHSALAALRETGGLISGKSLNQAQSDPAVIAELRSVGRNIVKAISNKKEIHISGPSKAEQVLKYKQGNKEYFKNGGFNV